MIDLELFNKKRKEKKYLDISTEELVEVIYVLKERTEYLLREINELKEKGEKSDD